MIWFNKGNSLFPISFDTIDWFSRMDFDDVPFSPGWFVVYNLPWYSKIAFAPNSFLASSKAFLKLVLYLGKPEDFAILKTEVPSFSICSLRLAISDFFISVCIKTIVPGDVLELIMS